MPNSSKSITLEVLVPVFRHTIRNAWRILLLLTRALIGCGGSKFALKLHFFKWHLQMIAFALQKWIQGMSFIYISLHVFYCSPFFQKKLYHVCTFCSLPCGFSCALLMVYLFFLTNSIDGCLYVTAIIWTFARMSLERASILMLIQQTYTMEEQKLLVQTLTFHSLSWNV